jgi:hypothetical protein
LEQNKKDIDLARKDFSQWTKKDIKKVLFDAAIFLIGFAILISIIEGVHSFWDNDANDKYEYTVDGKDQFTEARCLVGSIFYKDSMILSSDDIEIVTQSLFGKKKTVYPYHTIKEITFSKAFNGYKVVIEYPGSLFGTDRTTLYFNQKDTFDLLENDLKDYSKNRCIITESL